MRSDAAGPDLKNAITAGPVMQKTNNKSNRVKGKNK